MNHYIVCAHCGKTYDTNDSWHSTDHSAGTCQNIQYGYCDACGGNIGNLHTANSGEAVHIDHADCIHRLKEQVRYMEQYRLEHDMRYRDLEKAVQELTEGRKAALAESRTLKAIRENG